MSSNIEIENKLLKNKLNLIECVLKRITNELSNAKIRADSIGLENELLRMDNAALKNELKELTHKNDTRDYIHEIDRGQNDLRSTDYGMANTHDIEDIKREIRSNRIDDKLDSYKYIIEGKLDLFNKAIENKSHGHKFDIAVVKREIAAVKEELSHVNIEGLKTDIEGLKTKNENIIIDIKDVRNALDTDIEGLKTKNENIIIDIKDIRNAFDVNIKGLSEKIQCIENKLCKSIIGVVESVSILATELDTNINMIEGLRNAISH